MPDMEKVFEEAAATTTSRLAKQTFEFLAGEEDQGPFELIVLLQGLDEPTDPAVYSVHHGHDALAHTTVAALLREEGVKILAEPSLPPKMSAWWRNSLSLESTVCKSTRQCLLA